MTMLAVSRSLASTTYDAARDLESDVVEVVEARVAPGAGRHEAGRAGGIDLGLEAAPAERDGGGHDHHRRHGDPVVAQDAQVVGQFHRDIPVVGGGSLPAASLGARPLGRRRFNHSVTGPVRFSTPRAQLGTARERASHRPFASLIWAIDSSPRDHLPRRHTTHEGPFMSTQPRLQPTRRTVLRTAAWTAPAVSIAVAAPAFAAVSTTPACTNPARATGPTSTSPSGCKPGVGTVTSVTIGTTLAVLQTGPVARQARPASARSVPPTTSSSRRRLGLRDVDGHLHRLTNHVGAASATRARPATPTPGAVDAQYAGRYGDVRGTLGTSNCVRS